MSSAYKISSLIINPSFTRASDKCIAEKRKTITGDDVLVAMATLGFDNYIEPLKLYLQKYREVRVLFNCHFHSALNAMKLTWVWQSVALTTPTWVNDSLCAVAAIFHVCSVPQGQIKEWSPLSQLRQACPPILHVLESLPQILFNSSATLDHVSSH